MGLDLAMAAVDRDGAGSDDRRLPDAAGATQAELASLAEAVESLESVAEPVSVSRHDRARQHLSSNGSLDRVGTALDGDEHLAGRIRHFGDW